MSDLISREELKKTAKRIESMPWGDEDGNPVEFRWSPEELEALIDKAPSAERKGRWVGANEYAKHLTEKTGKFYMLSSIETDRFCNQSWKFGGKFKTNYCPHCGAKMELKEE